MKMMVIEIQNDSMKVTRREKTPEGYLILWGQSAREGVLQYPEKGMSQFVPRQVLSQSDSSFEGYPLSVEHPGAVTAKNWRAHGKGTILNAGTTDDGRRIIKMIIHDAKTVKLIEDENLQYLSEAYDVELVQQAGEFQGEPYTHVQMSRKPNHIALTKNPRAGTEGAFLMDSTMPLDPSQNPPQAPPTPPVPPTPEEPKQFDAAASFGRLEQMAQKQMDALTRIADAIVGKAPAPPSAPPVPGAPPQMDSEQVQAEIKRLVAQRVELEKAAGSVQMDSMPAENEELAKAVLKARGVEVKDEWSMDTLMALVQTAPAAKQWGSTKRTLNTDSAEAQETTEVPFDEDDAFFG